MGLYVLWCLQQKVKSGRKCLIKLNDQPDRVLTFTTYPLIWISGSSLKSESFLFASAVKRPTQLYNFKVKSGVANQNF